MTKIFISYRRSDDPYAARGINDALCKQFGKRNVFFDLDAIQAGLDFRKQIDAMVAECDVMLVVIGDDWLQLDESGCSRLENEDDLVLLEVSSALKRDIPVIPVLVGKATIPTKDSLPKEIESLVYRQAIEVRATANFSVQIDRLLRSVEAVAPETVQPEVIPEDGAAEVIEPDPATPSWLPKWKDLLPVFAIPFVVVIVVGLAWQPLMDWVSKREVTNTSVVDAEQSDSELTLNEDNVADNPEPEQKEPATLSQGRFPMPNVVGLSIAEAKEQVLLAGQNSGATIARATIIDRRTDERPAGQILEQFRRPGSLMSLDMDDMAGNYGEVTFRVWVSTGPEPESGLVIHRLMLKPLDGQAFKDCEECPEMVVIPAGSFVIEGSESHEKPQHRVSVSRFAIGKYEVTFDEYDTFARSTGKILPDDKTWGRSKRPVINVSWDDAQAYVKWLNLHVKLLNLHTDKQYRLPSEAEWEYSARAGTTTEYWWGDNIKQYGRVWANCSGCGGHDYEGGTAPVETFSVNPFGLYDTSGNVYEWVKDCWHDDYQNAPDDGSAWLEAEDCTQGVIRGGSWLSFPEGLRSAFRLSFVRTGTNHVIGFRLAQDLPD